MQAGIATAATPLIYSGSASAGEFTNEPGADTVKFGFTVALSGAYSDEGADELRAFQLAVQHLNGEGDGGMLNTMQPTSLQGNGVLGRRVEYVTADTETKPSIAADAARRLIDDDGVTMICGGSSSGVAIAMQAVCQEKGVVFMAGLTHQNDVTGADGVKNGFRHFLNAYMSNTALVSHLTQKYTESRKVYYLSADYAWGRQNQSTFQQKFEAAGWETVAAVPTPLAQTDFKPYLEAAVAAGADTLVMSLYGANMVNALVGAQELGLQDLDVNGKKMIFAVPVYSRLMSQGAGSSVAGVYSTVNWHWGLSDAASQVFASSFGEAYGFPPSSAAHTCYVQTLLYADACERAGTFNPCQVISALEGHSFSGLGNGACEYRAADHQCFKDVPVVKGKSNPTSQFDLLEIDATVARSVIEYPVNDAMFNANLGECSNGAASPGTGDDPAEGNPTNSDSTVGNPSDDGTSSSSGGGGAVSLGLLAALPAFAKLVSSPGVDDQEQ